MDKLKVIPITLREANDFIEQFHRHNGRTARDGGKFAIGAVYGNELVGVSIVGRPLARILDDGITAEVTRTCVNDKAPQNTNSFLYSRSWRIWQAMGGQRMITYTLTTESGSSLRGAGWRVVGQSKPHKNGWNRKDSPQCNRQWQPIYGQMKFRWEIETQEATNAKI